MTNEQYHQNTSMISKSGLDLIHKSPRHYWAKYLDPNRDPEDYEETDALMLGTALHSAILEPESFERTYIPKPAIDRKTKAGKEQWAELQQQIEVTKQLILAKDDMKNILRMRDAIYSHPAARKLLEKGIAEQTFTFKESISGAPCKIRPDWLSGLNFICDIKTTEDASPKGFAKSIANYRYDVQGAFYLDGLFENGYESDGFIFIAVEKKAPRNVGVYVLTDEQVIEGRRKYISDCEKYVSCLKTGHWHGYSDNIEEVQLPSWAK